MNNLFLADLQGMTEDEVKAHIADGYSGTTSDFGYVEATKKEIEDVTKTLEHHDVIIAYESVGDYGCDSSSWFLLYNKEDRKYYEFNGGHCSCYGFEGQFDLEETTLEDLKSDKFSFYCGGYDDHETENQRAVKEFIAAL